MQGTSVRCKISARRHPRGHDRFILVLELLTNQLLAELPKPLGVDFAGPPAPDFLLERIRKATIVEVGAIVLYVESAFCSERMAVWQP